MHSLVIFGDYEKDKSYIFFNSVVVFPCIYTWKRYCKVF